KLKNQIVPHIIKISTEKYNGLRIMYKDAIYYHLSQFLKKNPQQEGEYVLRIKDGIDGSGSHSIYNQKNSGGKDFENTSKNILSYMFVPLQLTNLSTSKVVWQEDKMNSSEVCRPLLLINAKETREVLKEIIPAVQKEANELKIMGLEMITAEGAHIKIYCD
ncbi:unnamed protein product, partial [Meganyctiphanes norvegica]